MVSQISERRIVGEPPLYEIPGWRELYGVTAGITGRGNGPGRGFDLGLWSEAPVGEVMGRWRLFKSIIPGFDGWVLGHQVHQTRVQTHDSARGWVTVEGMDGHLTGTDGILLLVTVADCIPVYLIDPVKRVAALLHSGWRGTAGSMLSVGVAAMVEGFGSSVLDIVMHCGIGICGSCYEVGSEVMDGCGIERNGAGPWHADLRQVLVDQAEGLGMINISTSQLCSCHGRPEFYSHRGSGGQDGRMVAYLGWPLGD